MCVRVYAQVVYQACTHTGGELSHPLRPDRRPQLFAQLPSFCESPGATEVMTLAAAGTIMNWLAAFSNSVGSEKEEIKLGENVEQTVFHSELQLWGHKLL